MNAPIVHDAREAIAAAGGAKVLAQLFGFGTSAIYNWYRRGFPPEAHALVGARLRELGVAYDDDLFRQYPLARKPKPKAKPTRRKRQKREMRKRARQARVMHATRKRRNGKRR